MERIGKQIDPPLKADLLKRINSLLSGNYSLNYIAAEPVALTTVNFNLLLDGDYFVYENTAKRYFLYLVWNNVKGPKAYLIDELDSIKSLDLFFPLPNSNLKNFHNDTLLDGELVFEPDENNQVLKFVVTDLVVINGTNIVARSLNTRLGYVQSDVIKPHKDYLALHTDYKPQLIVDMKKQERSYGVLTTFKIPPGITPKYIFAPVRHNYTPGVSSRLLCWTMVTENAFFRIKSELDEDRKPHYRIWALSDGSEKYFDQITLEPQIIERWRSNSPVGKIGEFMYDKSWKTFLYEKGYAPVERMGGWRFIGFPDDVEKVTDVATANRIIDTAKFGIDRNEMESRIEQMRSNWKAREKRQNSIKSPQSAQSLPFPNTQLSDFITEMKNVGPQSRRGSSIMNLSPESKTCVTEKNVFDPDLDLPPPLPPSANNQTESRTHMRRESTPFQIPEKDVRKIESQSTPQSKSLTDDVAEPSLTSPMSQMSASIVPEQPQQQTMTNPPVFGVTAQRKRSVSGLLSHPVPISFKNEDENYDEEVEEEGDVLIEETETALPTQSKPLNSSQSPIHASHVATNLSLEDSKESPKKKQKMAHSPEIADRIQTDDNPRVEPNPIVGYVNANEPIVASTGNTEITTSPHTMIMSTNAVPNSQVQKRKEYKIKHLTPSPVSSPQFSHAISPPPLSATQQHVLPVPNNNHIYYQQPQLPQLQQQQRQIFQQQQFQQQQYTNYSRPNSVAPPPYTPMANQSWPDQPVYNNSIQQPPDPRSGILASGSHRGVLTNTTVTAPPPVYQTQKSPVLQQVHSSYSTTTHAGRPPPYGNNKAYNTNTGISRPSPAVTTSGTTGNSPNIVQGFNSGSSSGYSNRQDPVMYPQHNQQQIQQRYTTQQIPQQYYIQQQQNQIQQRRNSRPQVVYAQNLYNGQFQQIQHTQQQQVYSSQSMVSNSPRFYPSTNVYDNARRTSVVSVRSVNEEMDRGDGWRYQQINQQQQQQQTVAMNQRQQSVQQSAQASEQKSAPSWFDVVMGK